MTETNDTDMIEVCTSAGVLRAYRSTDPGQPGICVTLQPAGYDCEIDMSYVSVYEDPEYMTSDGERPVDVSIMTYGDAYSEDYTNKVLIRREDVMAALGSDNESDTVEITVYADATGLFSEKEIEEENLTEIAVSKDLLSSWFEEQGYRLQAKTLEDFLKSYTADDTECLVNWLIDKGYGLEVPGLKVYKYGMKRRPYSIGCQPMDNLAFRENDKSGKYYDVLVYRKPLTKEDVDHYDLEPVA